MVKVGVIGGSGLYEIPGFQITEQREMETRFGLPSAPYMIGQLEGVSMAFLPRHGLKHEYPPHKINYLANLRGFWDMGVERIISVSASGGIDPALRVGDIVVADQVLDFTMGSRLSSFYDADEVVHVDFTEPYCAELRAMLLQSGKQLGAPVLDGGTYACVCGPRLESKAEIKFLASAGAHLVGMSGMPEAALARELEICYSLITVVTNAAAGTRGGAKLTTEEVLETMRKSNDMIKTILRETIKRLPPERTCPCKDALKGSRL